MPKYKELQEELIGSTEWIFIVIGNGGSKAFEN